MLDKQENEDLAEPLLTTSKYDVEKSERTKNDASLSFPWWVGWDNGVVCGIIAAVAMSIHVLCAKLLEGHVPGHEIAFSRAVLCFIFSVVLAWLIHLHPMFGHLKNSPLMALRGLFGAASVVTHYMSLFRMNVVTHYMSLFSLPIADAVLLNCLHPLLAALAAWLLFGEAFGLRDAIGGMLALSGLFLLGSNSATPPGNERDYNNTRLYGLLTGLASTSLAIGGALCVKMIGDREHALSIAIWFHLLVSITSGVPVFLSWHSAQGMPYPTVWEMEMMILIAIMSFIAQLFATRSLQLLPVYLALCFTFLSVALTYAYGLCVFHESVSTSGLSGAALIAMGVFISVHRR
ncbi:hypothetical protein CEUSTIGMA_g662.t1 [Chlamydomonas eustigma]|uniref:EamA domain-containing protein n=1 Tax=Chlamydomonas eustigma TaxID=1157962 RepID=A0A250WR87_9CHLO|nr:hypothetical protein CEUSTIGMA_g662.t1 [Chlamydomonas eustigma]|eukprot:GAX73209.1 hypothetical protein CEUSTIGMA_g662.t1 [Chlamydomonas eustigma]